MLMTRPTMVMRLGATHIGQRVTNQFQNLGSFTLTSGYISILTFAWWDREWRRRTKSTCAPSASAAREHWIWFRLSNFVSGCQTLIQVVKLWFRLSNFDSGCQTRSSCHFLEDKVPTWVWGCLAESFSPPQIAPGALSEMGLVVDKRFCSKIHFELAVLNSCLYSTTEQVEDDWKVEIIC